MCQGRWKAFGLLLAQPRHFYRFGFNEQFAIYGMEDIELGYRLERQGSRMIHGPDAKAIHQYFPTYPQFVRRCEQAGYSLGRMIELHPELRSRFVESGKRTHLLKRIHGLYRVFSTAARPLTGALARWEERRGCGQVSPLLDRHYYWALRYHFLDTTSTPATLGTTRTETASCISKRNRYPA